jgi:hypothetical protein
MLCTLCRITEGTRHSFGWYQSISFSLGRSELPQRLDSLVTPLVGVRTSWLIFAKTPTFRVAALGAAHDSGSAFSRKGHRLHAAHSVRSAAETATTIQTKQFPVLCEQNGALSSCSALEFQPTSSNLIPETAIRVKTSYKAASSATMPFIGSGASDSKTD